MVDAVGNQIQTNPVGVALELASAIYALVERNKALEAGSAAWRDHVTTLEKRLDQIKDQLIDREARIRELTIAEGRLNKAVHEGTVDIAALQVQLAEMAKERDKEQRWARDYKYLVDIGSQALSEARRERDEAETELATLWKMLASEKVQETVENVAAAINMAGADTSGERAN